MTDHAPILIVDDDVDLRDILKDVLEFEGYEVLSAANGEKALEVLRSSPRPCLILLDLMMPVMDGYEFLREQKKDPSLASIPVAIITAGGRVDASRTFEAPVVRKPIGLSTLLTVVEQLC